MKIRTFNSWLTNTKNPFIINGKPVENIYRIWLENKEDKLTQLVFCDLSTPKNDGTFNVYDDIKKKLIEKALYITIIEKIIWHRHNKYDEKVIPTYIEICNYLY